MDCGHSQYRPTVPYFGNDLRDLVNDLLVVGLILEVRDIGPSRRVIAHGPNEQHDGTGLRCGDRSDNRGRIDRIG